MQNNLNDGFNTQDNSFGTQQPQQPQQQYPQYPQQQYPQYPQQQYPQMGYGAPQYGYSQPAAPGHGFAIAGMVCGIVSLLMFTLVTGTLGIVFGVVAKNKGNSSGMATAGIVCGAIGLGLWLIMMIACGSAGLFFL